MHISSSCTFGRRAVRTKAQSRAASTFYLIGCRRAFARSLAVEAKAPDLTRATFASRMAAEQTIHLDRYAADAKALVAGAQALADERKHAQVEPLHLLARAIDRDPGVAEVFKKAGAAPAD